MKTALRKGGGLLVALSLFLLLGGALPGQMRGCSTDLSDEVDHIEYCQDKCEAICDRMVRCGVYVPAVEPGPDEEVEDVCERECGDHFGCDRPFFCTDPEAYISEEEAATCLGDWPTEMTCPVMEGFPTCVPFFFHHTDDDGRELCPRPSSCEAEELCDPPDWE